tara:strand:+ start:3233 stop:3499 length:267 start_codon:yes stop_codon:yes gene_type:complete
LTIPREYDLRESVEATYKGIQMIYSVYFMTNDSATHTSPISRPILCAAFLCRSEAEKYAKGQGDSFMVKDVDAWKAWNSLLNGLEENV